LGRELNRTKMRYDSMVNVPRRSPEPYVSYPAQRQVYRNDRRFVRFGRSPRITPTLLLLAGVAAFFALLLMPAAAALGGYAYFQVFDLILPRVRVGNTALGGQNVYNAAVRLNRVWNMENDLLVGVLVGGEIRSWQVRPGDVGLSVDAVESAHRAYQVGRGPRGVIAFDRMASSLINSNEVVPAVHFDPTAARAGLEALSTQVSLPPQDATLRLEGNQVLVIPASAGYVLDVEGAVSALAANPLAILVDGYLAVNLKPVEPRITDVSAAAAEAERLLNSQVTISGYEPVRDEHLSWTVPAETIRSWLVIETGEAGPVVTIDENQVAGYLSGLSDSLGPERFIDVSNYSASLNQAIKEGTPLTVRVGHRPTTYVVQGGDTLTAIGWKVGIPYWKIIEANPGLDVDNLWAGMELTIPSKDEMLPLPVIPGKRVIISIGEQRLRVYQDGNLLSEHVISTGIDRSPTQPGVFQVQTHEINAYASVWDLHMPHFLGIYEAWPGFMNGIHGLPTLSNGRRLWGNILGRPASYGCIIMDLDAAEFLYNWAEAGVIVEIRP
jgi:lipoprotein-anchoring transpeptidase ErfK/SrfK